MALIPATTMYATVSRAECKYRKKLHYKREASFHRMFLLDLRLRRATESPLTTVLTVPHPNRETAIEQTSAFLNLCVILFGNIDSFLSDNLQTRSLPDLKLIDCANEKSDSYHSGSSK
ncbi:MAG: hypothetical protein AAB259_05570 [Pseudomonadota bacterium]